MNANGPNILNCREMNATCAMPKTKIKPQLQAARNNVLPKYGQVHLFVRLFFFINEYNNKRTRCNVFFFNNYC